MSYKLIIKSYRIRLTLKLMSKCHFPHDNHTIILDFPSLSHLNSTLLFIQTTKNIVIPSSLSLSCFERSYPQVNDQCQEDSLGLSIQNQELILEESNRKKKAGKTGCTCKKTNCLKMYCQCFSTGKMCTPQCACYGCYNHTQHQKAIDLAKQQLKLKGTVSNRHTDRACNCKKSQCQKKYCQCYNAGLPCTQACNCCDCYNNKQSKQGQSEQCSKRHKNSKHQHSKHQRTYNESQQDESA